VAASRDEGPEHLDVSLGHAKVAQLHLLLLLLLLLLVSCIPRAHEK
jgi:hypothetical protein